MSKPVPKPDFVPGNVIASNLYMGVVKGAFWDDTWCYIIGNNASVPADEQGYLIGSKFIKRGDVKMYLKDGEWVSV